MSAIFANRQLQIVAEGLDKSIQKLSSGQTINGPGDDPSGFAVSERMRTQINGMSQAERNAQNGISFIQVSEGSYQQITDILQRIRQLAVQSANGIYSNRDRMMIQVEVSQLVQEIDRISTSAQFNGMRMLTGAFARDSNVGSMYFHIGPNQNERIQVYIATVSSRAFNLISPEGDRRSVSTAGQANAMIGYIDNALDRLNMQRADIGAYYNRMGNTIASLAISEENMIAAYSRIRDVNMASEMVEYTRSQILVQTSVAMLAQANFKPKLVMRLLE
jgi:flagellin